MKYRVICIKGATETLDSDNRVSGYAFDLDLRELEPRTGPGDRS